MHHKVIGRFYGLAYPLARLWWRFSAPVRIGVRAIVLDPEQRVLLVRHAYGNEGWSFPGGGPGRREPLSRTAVREIWEETGINCRVERLLGLYDSFIEGKSDHVALFVCRSSAGEIPYPRSPEILSAGFFPLDALPPTTSAGARQRLAELAGGQQAVIAFW